MAADKAYTVTQEQLDDMRHALGWSHTPDVEGLGWRNYYHASDDDRPRLMLLVDQGLMVNVHENYFMVTKNGGRLVGMPESRINSALCTFPREIA